MGAVAAMTPTVTIEAVVTEVMMMATMTTAAAAVYSMMATKSGCYLKIC